MKITIVNDEGITCSRQIKNSDNICQLICDIIGYFLPRNKRIEIRAELNSKEYVAGITNEAAVCELMNMLWKDWRFDDNEYETI